MSTNSYQPIPSQSPPVSRSNSPSTSQTTFPPRPNHPSDGEDEEYHERLRGYQAEFNRPPPAWWKRVLLILAIIAMGWLSIYLGRRGMSKKPQVIYASRYSEEFKYRPAASPVITETLSDGRIRIRGASVGGVGVREEDIPLTPAMKAKRDQERREEAREKAREKMGLKTRNKKKAKRSAKKTKA
ncbi:hypothetical protein J008_04835 [Cryptococcus neoformans]|uniref:Cbb3-type cytochrome c oxidase subunit CcoP N-terminal domain-containing protein n=2 Tax=Cryptococcus neoformans TaxID=5207 RepID=A0A854Q6E1_CRYNE|nr:hypothetical protein CNAG_04193 [Cryptococcus neoformans var. grubii H99]AUB26893.1 hypothetical protein CKF44_04193 [Cryptococcus neoformans var. grubii]OWZ29231.1 hypothetical protein C347_05099 [Cryptococcus neoformans var. grubii AD2-60a]OWZ36108.1 hypothetical protein C353_04950 [Cryptococcus neoformans var. grubii AD1-83a]OWZ41097.1 hypothetical protein C343_05053 [Cryptococcus neoformans var. grubii C23]OWZ52167.1 hypothetical protein C368_05209 [Cryptococcus neoformans var. grubii 1|eukprot:XP_012051652.1 hypothetical protein CNAG_04193 [Cryptococcus neoformans var. grubii H99]